MRNRGLTATSRTSRGASAKSRLRRARRGPAPRERRGLPGTTSTRFPGSSASGSRVPRAGLRSGSRMRGRCLPARGDRVRNDGLLLRRRRDLARRCGRARPRAAVLLRRSGCRSRDVPGIGAAVLAIYGGLDERINQNIPAIFAEAAVLPSPPRNRRNVLVDALVEPAVRSRAPPRRFPERPAPAPERRKKAPRPRRSGTPTATRQVTAPPSQKPVIPTRSSARAKAATSHTRGAPQILHVARGTALPRIPGIASKSCLAVPPSRESKVHGEPDVAGFRRAA